jgi:hypothetical protein
MSEIIKCYRFVTNDLKSQNGNTEWIIGEWQKHKGKLEICKQGLHACREPLDNLDYVFGERWFIAEAKGKILEDENKFCASEMRLIREIPLRVIQQFAIDCAERVLPLFEKECSDDKRPRLAIEAAKQCLLNSTKKTWSAAESAAKSASSAAESAAKSASSAAWSAAESAAKSSSAAESAAKSASSAAWSASSAAWSAASSAAWSAEFAAESAARSAAKSASSAAESAAKSAAESAESERMWQNQHLKQLIEEMN